MERGCTPTYQRLHQRLQPRVSEAAAPCIRGCHPTHLQENLSLSAWKGLAGVPKVGRRDEHAHPSGVELEEQADDPDGSPFPAQCRGMVTAPSWWCHSSLPRPPRGPTLSAPRLRCALGTSRSAAQGPMGGCGAAVRPAEVADPAVWSTQVQLRHP